MSVLVLVTLTEIFLAVWNRPPASLGELALREAVRRHSVPASVRSVTDADLGPPPARAPRQAPRAAQPPALTGIGVAKAVEAQPGGGSEAPKEVQKDEAWWRARMAQARLALERNQLLIKALEGRVAALTQDVVNRDDPAQRAVLGAERLRVLDELDRVKKQLSADVEVITAIEEEARREGVPPGWIR